MAASKGFSTMQTNIGNMVKDTSAAFAVIVGNWINDAYQDAWRRAMWTDLVDEDKTFESVVNQNAYTFTTSMSITDFGEELFVADIANGHALTRYQIRDWWVNRSSAYSADSIDSGNPVRYKILPEADTLYLDPAPDKAETYAMPYKKKVVDLSGTTAPGINSISLYLEEYAMGLAFAYYNQYQKATWWANRAENTLRKLIKEEYVKINQMYQRIAINYRLPVIGRLLGENSYDSV